MAVGVRPPHAGRHARYSGRQPFIRPRHRTPFRSPLPPRAAAMFSPSGPDGCTSMAFLRRTTAIQRQRCGISALAEISNTPQPPPATETGAINYTAQPYMPLGTSLPSGNGPFLAYLDVWVRPVDFLNDSDLIDKAVGIDSTGRLQTAWQVKLLDLSTSAPGATCDSNIPGWPPPASAGLLTTGTTPTPPSGPCCLTAGTAYTGMENQFYRVEIHQHGVPESSAVPPVGLGSGIATFKWSRDNGSVVTGVTNISNVTNSLGNPASQLAVQSLGRDQVLGFAPGNWIEVVDDSLEFAGMPGELHQIDTIDFSSKTITLANKLTRLLHRRHGPNPPYAHSPLGPVGQGVRRRWKNCLVGHRCAGCSRHSRATLRHFTDCRERHHCQLRPELIGRLVPYAATSGTSPRAPPTARLRSLKKRRPAVFIITTHGYRSSPSPVRRRTAARRGRHRAARNRSVAAAAPVPWATAWRALGNTSRLTTP